MYEMSAPFIYHYTGTGVVGNHNITKNRVNLYSIKFYEKGHVFYITLTYKKDTILFISLSVISKIAPPPCSYGHAQCHYMPTNYSYDYV